MDSEPRTEPPSLFVPGENCWRVARADRVSVLVDGEAYFAAVRQAIVAARDSVFILGWDIDSRMRLCPGGAGDGLPEPLGEFLHACCVRRRGLRVHVLNWDFSMLYALEREWLPEIKLGWRTHRRLHFRLDDRHASGASHHQKVVVVDDRLAFVGGLDLTNSRWDTPAHAADDPLRRNADGKPYPPFHDVAAMIEGPAAESIGDLARDRWQRATGRRPRGRSLRARVGGQASPWPERVAPDFTDVQVAIARTEAAFDERPAVEEIRKLHAAAIARARRHLYFENQYFTAAMLGEQLGARLAQPDGPDVVVVSRRKESGWLEEATMGVLRARLHAQLRAIDPGQRYRLYCPEVPGVTAECVNVHSKLMIVDDELLSLGSANLNNRSMVLDTECNVAIEARGMPARRAAIAAVRNRLLAEHLGTTEQAVAGATRERGRLLAAVEALRASGGRTLDRLEPEMSPELDSLVPDIELIDPEKPLDTDAIVERFVPREARKPVPGKLIALGLLAVFLGLLAVTWKWTPLREYLNIDALTRIAEQMDGLWYTPIAVVGSYVLGGLLVIPVTALIAVTGIVFGPLVGGAYAFAGSLASALVTYLIGRSLGRDTVARVAGKRVGRLNDRLARRGITAMAVLRLVPVAPFSVVNVVAGATKISMRDYLIGTAIGLTPGIVVTVAFAYNLLEAVRHPSAATLAILAIVAGALIGLAIVTRKVFGEKRRDSQPADGRRGGEAGAAADDDAGGAQGEQGEQGEQATQAERSRAFARRAASVEAIAVNADADAHEGAR